MNGKSSSDKSIIVVVALFGGIAGVALADGSSVSRFGGDGYAYFNGQMPVVDPAQYQGLSSGGPEWHPAPDINRSGAKFRERNPSGLPFSDYQALSSNSSRWQMRPSN